MVPAGFSSIVRGKFAGHIHVAYDTDSALFTQVGAITEAAMDTAFFVGQISESTDYALRVSKQQDMFSYRKQPEGLHKPADPALWQQ